MGGSDDPNNLVRLTIQEHADAHLELYRKHGKREDYIAWMGLSNQIGKEEIIFEVFSMNGKRNGPKNRGNKRPDLSKRNRTPEMIEAVSRPKPGTSRAMMGNTNHHHGVQVTCPHCNTIGSKPIMNRWHFNKCRSLR